MTMSMRHLTWNMSQSGTTISPRRRLLKATEAMCKVWNVGSLGMKSSDALATALFFELNKQDITCQNQHSEESRHLINYLLRIM